MVKGFGSLKEYTIRLWGASELQFLSKKKKKKKISFLIIFK